MGNLTTFTVYNDECDLIIKYPKEFAHEIYKACSSINNNSYVFRNVVISQKTRHSDDNTIYIHYGNTLCEMNPYSNKTQEIMINNPHYFKELLNIMDYNLKKLKQDFKKVDNVQ